MFHWLLDVKQYIFIKCTLNHLISLQIADNQEQSEPLN